MQISRMDIIKQLETYRLEHRISQQDLAKKLHVAFSTVNRWLNGKSRPSKIQTYHIRKLLLGRVTKSLERTLRA
jgi:transcriptional regulator with XRE-family HTH domain